MESEISQSRSSDVGKPFASASAVTRLVHDRLSACISESMKEEGVEVMIRLVKQLSVLVLIGVIANGVAFAKTIKKGITFADPVVVNGTVVKKGSYDVVFDDQTNELTFHKDGKVVATAPAKLETRERDHAVYITREEGGSAAATLLSVSVGKDTQATLENNGNGNSAQ